MEGFSFIKCLRNVKMKFDIAKRVKIFCHLHTSLILLNSTRTFGRDEGMFSTSTFPSSAAELYKSQPTLPIGGWDSYPDNRCEDALCPSDLKDAP